MSATPDTTFTNPEQLIADLQRQLAEAREQQAATTEVLQVINSSPGDLAPVFDAMLAKAMELCDAAFGGLFTYDGERFPSMAFRGLPPPLVEFFRGPVPPSPITRRIINGEPVVHIADITAEEAFRSGEAPGLRALAGVGEARTMIWVALRKERTLLGVFSMYRQEVRPFTDKQIVLLESFAAQAVIAMENARLLTETREALEQQTATAEVLGVINASPGNLSPVFNAMLEKALTICGADQGLLRIFDGELFHVVAISGGERAERLRQLGPIRGAEDSSFYGRLAQGERFVHIIDARKTDTYRNDPKSRERLEARGIHTWLAVALQKEDVLLGALVIHRSEVRPFADKQIALLQNFAAQAVIAMENAFPARISRRVGAAGQPVRRYARPVLG